VTVRVDGKDVVKSGAITKYDAIAPGSLEEECENLVDLETFNEGIILHHVKTRFNKLMIYTYVGSILIALNPYKSLDLYGIPLMEGVMNKLKANQTLPPHVYSIGATALYNLRTEGKDQAVLISGESGAGKTEATKRILQFLSTMAGSTSSRVGVSVEKQILDSNPLLESFGNAKTLRNNNSSRFGKFMEVNFDRKNNIKGCNVVAYLLEKSRVVKQTPNERNYHAFYMLIEGASKEMRREFDLKPAEQFFYLSQSGCTTIPRRSDKQEFEELLAAMESLRIDPAVRIQIFQALAGILHLGNLTFVPSGGNGGGEGCSIANGSDCRIVCTLLGINASSLETALCFRENTVRGETTFTPLSPVKAVDQRDALAKYIYGRIFDTIVARVNQSLFRGKVGNSIGVLDIFGFEVFRVNSFEQLCINYCNERLQTFFNEIIFDGEIKMYNLEGVPCDDITYQDNIGCVKLIDAKGASLFACLDDECKVGGGSDDKYAGKLHQIFDESNATKSGYYGRIRKNPREFVVHHFAGPVTYTVTDFMEKNKDALAVKILEELKRSTLSMLRDEEESGPDLSAAPGTPGGTGPASPDKSKGGKLNLCQKFKLDLDKLMDVLRKTTPHFIRCVKPNDLQAPDRFEPPLALNQLKYSGLFEAIRIRKSGYAVRMPMDQFVKRYSVCCANIIKESKAKGAELCTLMLKSLGQLIKMDNENGAPRQWFVGTSRIFIRSQQFRYMIESLREKKVSIYAVPIQKLARGFVARRRFIRIVAPHLANKEADRKLARREIQEMEREDALAMSLEMIVRNDKELQAKLAQARLDRIVAEAQKQKMRMKNAATAIQRIFRGKFYRIRGKVFMCEELFARAFEFRDEETLKRALVMPALLGVTSKLIKMYQHDAKDLILEVLHETHVKNELAFAIRSGTVELLEQAIALAVGNKVLQHLPIVREARAALNELNQRRSVLSVLEGVLSRCVTVPALLSRVDKIRSLVQQCTELGLGGEYLVTDANIRLKRIATLIAVRDKIRFAVEICSANDIKSAMHERAKLLKIYGPDFCAEEIVAVAGMEKMFLHEQQMVLYRKQRAEMAEAEDFPAEEMKLTSDAGLEKEGSDIRLPPWVLQQLELMRNAVNERELNKAMDDFAVLVPAQDIRGEYVRMFKWVVAFATWRFAATPEEKLANEKHRKLVEAANNSEDATRRLMTKLQEESDAAATSTSSANMPVSPKSKQPRSGTILSTPQKGTKVGALSAQATPTSAAKSLAQSFGASSSGGKVSPRSVPLSARSTVDAPLALQYSRAKGMSSTFSPGFSFGSSPRDGRAEKKATAAIPSPTLFCQRQSKSEVAAYIAQKNAQRVSNAC
jgi:myosin heavy subunit